MFSKIKALIFISCCYCTHITEIQAETVRVVTEYLSFYQQANKDGSLGGYSTEVVKALFEETGDTPEFEINPWARSYYEALHNANVMLYSMAYNPQRAPLFECVGVLTTERLYFWGMAEKFAQPVTGVEELRKYSIALSKFSNPDQYLTAQGFEKLIRIGNPEQAFGMLFKGRIDLIISGEDSVSILAEKYGYDANLLKKVYEIDALNHRLCIVFNKDSDPNMINRYKKAFETIDQNGVLQSIKQRWNVNN